jgi:hypothetical protein
MKYFLSILVAITLFSACKEKVKGKDGRVYESPTAYNDFIVNRQTVIIKNVLALSDITDDKLDEGMALMKRTVDTIGFMIGELKAMPPYGKDSTLRDAAIDLFGFYQRIFGKDYQEILQIRKDGGTQTEEGIARITEIVDNVSKEEKVLDAKFASAQQAFAKEHKMRIQENTMQDKIDQISK